MTVNIELNNDEALVLFEWIAQREEEQEHPAVSAETKVFWSIEAQLERELTEPFDPNYQQLLEEARFRIRER